MRAAFQPLLVSPLLLGCAPSEPEAEFSLIKAPSESASFLLERNSGCLWSVRVVVPDLDATKESYSNEEFDVLVNNQERAWDWSKKTGEFEITNVRSAKTSLCNDKFGFVKTADQGK